MIDPTQERKCLEAIVDGQDAWPEFWRIYGWIIRDEVRGFGITDHDCRCIQSAVCLRLGSQQNWYALAQCILGITLGLICLAGCAGPDSQTPEVVVYVSVDQHHAEPLLRTFEQQTGISVKAVYDVEAAKTTGLVNRLLAERSNPRADVFWSGEVVQTVLLAEENVLQSYQPPTATGLPDNYSDPASRWTGFAGRARVILVNTELVAKVDYPTSFADLLVERWPAEKIAIALPLFGTTATHACVLYAEMGAEPARGLFERIQARGVRIEAGNAMVRDLVADGTICWGLTDTDDAAGAIERGAPVAVVFPDQEPDGRGTFVIPNTVALINGAANLTEAQQLIDYLVSEEAERQMVASGWCHVPPRISDTEPRLIDGRGVSRMDVEPALIYGELERVKSDLAEIFIR